VLRHVFPRADVPVVQFSIDESQGPEFHYELGKLLAPLRDEGVLVIGSGNLVHNLHAYAWGRRPAEPFDWAVRFERETRARIAAGDIAPLLEYESLGKDALLSVPPPELPPSPLRARPAPRGRSRDLSRRGDGRRLDLDADRAGGLTPARVRVPGVGLRENSAI
jgi:hypothetical protein